MTSTAHAIVASAIALKFPDPVTAVSLSFASHFVMDLIPHWDMGTNWRNRNKTQTGTFAIIETLTGITIAYLAYNASVPLGHLAIAISASLLPDWLEIPWFLFFAHRNSEKLRHDAGFFEKISFAIYKGESLFHTKAQFPFGVFTQILTVILFLIMLSK